MYLLAIIRMCVYTHPFHSTVLFKSIQINKLLVSNAEDERLFPHQEDKILQGKGWFAGMG